MFELTVDREFCAAHALVIQGTREPLHGHNWQVRVCIAGPRLDADGLLCDFHALAAALDQVLEPLHNVNLHDVAPFRDDVSPTAENVARHIATGVRHALDTSLPDGVRVRSASVTEAPGCRATYLLSPESEVRLPS